MSTTTAPATPATAEKWPSAETMQHAVKQAIAHDRPILMDYWVASCNKQALIGIKANDDSVKHLVKSEDEYTSPIVKIFQVKDEFIVMTENSIYIVSNSIPRRKIS